jgi:iron(III) transport system permease protein
MSTATARIKPRRLRFLISTKQIVIGVAVLLFVGICLLPLICMLIASLVRPDGGITWDNYRRLLTEARQWDLLKNSALLGAATALVATALGAPFGCFLARVDFPARHVLRLALIVPLILPSEVLALAWIYVSGPAGIVTRLFGTDLMAGWTYSMAGAVVVLSISLFPLAMLATEAAARLVDGRLEEAGLLVATPGRVFTRITLPLIAPGVGAAALLTFVFALSQFGVPGLLRVRVFTTEVFTAFAAQYDFGRATALSAPLLLLTVLAGVLLKVMAGDRFLTTPRSTQPGLRIRLGRFRLAAFIWIAIALTVSVFLPIGVLVVEAGGLADAASAAGASTAAITNSVVLSLSAAVLAVPLGLLLGYGRARTRNRTAGLGDIALVAAFAAPSTVLGVGLIGIWNRPGWPAEVYRSPLIILLACLARCLPIAALILAAAVRQVSPSLEEAADVAGAGWLRTLRVIVFPRISAAVVATLMVSFIFAFGELGATVLVAPPGESTLPVRIYTLIANAPSSQIAALALVQTGVVLAPLVLFAGFLRSRAG